jgi:hypothetical protein
MKIVGTHNRPPGQEHNPEPSENEAEFRRSALTPRDKTFQSSSCLALVSGINGSAEGLHFKLL